MLHQAWGGFVKGVEAKIPLLGSKFDKTNFHSVDQENRHISDWTQLNNSIGNILKILAYQQKPACYSDEKMTLWIYSLLGPLCHYQGSLYRECLFCLLSEPQNALPHKII